MQKWEYLVVEIKRGTQDHFVIHAINDEKQSSMLPYHTYLQELGKDGWELTGIRNEYYYFKRPIEE